MNEIVALRVAHANAVGEGGFLQIQRVALRNVFVDGSTSVPYSMDWVHRPKGQDGVVLVMWRRASTGVEILLRQGLRPALSLGRAATLAPLPEAAPPLSLWELPAGIIETHEMQAALTAEAKRTALWARASAEALEETGLVIAPEAWQALGAGTYASPGMYAEKFYFVAAEVVQGAVAGEALGDGSPMEQGARCEFWALARARAACVTGELCDAKTEIALARFAATPWAEEAMGLGSR